MAGLEKATGGGNHLEAALTACRAGPRPRAGPGKSRKMKKLGVIILILTFTSIPEMARGIPSPSSKPAGQQIAANESGQQGKVASAGQRSSGAKKSKAAKKRKKK